MLKRSMTHSVDEDETEQDDGANDQLSPKDPSPSVDGVVTGRCSHSEKRRDRRQTREAGRKGEPEVSTAR